MSLGAFGLLAVEHILNQGGHAATDVHSLTDKNPKEKKMKIFNSLAEMAETDTFTNPDIMRDQPFTVDGRQDLITHEYEDLFSLVVDLVENIPGGEFLSVQVTPHHTIAVIATNGTRVTRVIRPVTPFVLTVTVKDGLTPDSPSPSHCRCGAQSAPKPTPTVFEPPVRAVPELNYPYGPMAESHHYIARRAICKQGFGNPVRVKENQK